MRRDRSHPLCSRSGTFASLGLFFVLVLGIAMESQLLSQAGHGVDAQPFASAQGGIIPVTARHVTHTGRQAMPTQLQDAPPIWRPGFQWHYRWSDLRGSGTYIRAITDEENLDGTPHYVMRTGNRNIYWSKNDLSWLMEQVNGEVETQAAPAYRKFTWPMDPGKTWVTRYHWTHPIDGKTEERFRRHRIVGTESVDVPAGRYQAVHVVVTDAAGKKVNEYWYGPEVRWLVKERIYLEHGVRERELVYTSLWPKAPAH